MMAMLMAVVTMILMMMMMMTSDCWAAARLRLTNTRATKI